MKTASAPSQLPFAPRPFINELFSSWMLRIADANCVSLQELMLGFQCRHPDVPCPNSLDWGFSPAFLKAMARFCRTPISTLHSLDLRTRLPQAENVLLLRFRAASDQCLRLRKQRVGYAFCPNLHCSTTLCARSLGLGLPCPAPLSCSQEPAQTRMSNVWRRRPTSLRRSGCCVDPLLELRSTLDRQSWFACRAR